MHDLLSGWMEAKSSRDNFNFVMPTQSSDAGCDVEVFRPSSQIEDSLTFSKAYSLLGFLIVVNEIVGRSRLVVVECHWRCGRSRRKCFMKRRRRWNARRPVDCLLNVVENRSTLLEGDEEQTGRLAGASLLLGNCCIYHKLNNFSQLAVAERKSDV